MVSSSLLQANNIRVMLLGMVDDPRVVLIKLADRLHNMRTMYCGSLLHICMFQTAAHVCHTLFLQCCEIFIIFTSRVFLLHITVFHSFALQMFRNQPIVFRGFYKSGPYFLLAYQIFLQICSASSQSPSCCTGNISYLVFTCVPIRPLGPES